LHLIVRRTDVRTNFGFYVSFKKTTRANLECQPIFQGEAEIFVPRPCRRVQTGTGKARCVKFFFFFLLVTNHNVPVRHPYLVVTFWPGERLPRLRVTTRALLRQHIQANQSHFKGVDIPGIIPSNCVQRRNPLRASSSVATTYSPRPESLSQACSGPTPG
jgi:hypothetical protein